MMIKSRQKEKEKKTRFLRDSMSNRARRHFSATFELITESDDNDNIHITIPQPSSPPKKRLITDSSPKIELRLPPIAKLTPSRKEKLSTIHIEKKLDMNIEKRYPNDVENSYFKDDVII